MVNENQHKFHAKLKAISPKSALVETSNSVVSMNFSRTIGKTKDWIGVGFMHKAGNDTDHVDINFPFYSLVYVVSGSGTYIDASGKTYALSAGNIFQRHPGVLHSSFVEMDSGWKEYYLDCNTELYKKLCSMMLINRSISVLPTTFGKAVTSQIETLMNTLKTVPEHKIFDAYLKYLEILQLIFSSHVNVTDQDNMVEKALIDFNQQYKTRFDLKEFCKDKGWGYEKFRKAFKKSKGVSPRDYLIRKRMDEACRLLRSSDKLISQISTELGYSSQYEFSNQFKRYFNVFPKHYRNGV